MLPSTSGAADEPCEVIFYSGTKKSRAQQKSKQRRRKSAQTAGSVALPVPEAAPVATEATPVSPEATPKAPEATPKAPEAEPSGFQIHRAYVAARTSASRRSSDAAAQLPISRQATLFDLPGSTAAVELDVSDVQARPKPPASLDRWRAQLEDEIQVVESLIAARRLELGLLT